MSNPGSPSTSGASPRQQHQPPLRARLHVLLQHQDSQPGSSPALSPSSDAPSQHLPSSSTSIDSADQLPPSRRKCRRGAVNVLFQATEPSSSKWMPSIVSSTPPRLAALPRSVTTSNLDSIAAVVHRSDPNSSSPSRASSLDPSLLPANFAIPVPATQSNKLDDAPAPDTRPLQRPSIKVRIITWNMHDSVPKGDLEVLLGKAGQFVAPETDWDVSYDSADDDGLENSHPDRTKSRGAHVVGQEHVPRADRIPPLPHDDSHPYHLLVIAGQECPWGDGKRLATSVGMAGELGDIGKQKTRAAKDRNKDKDKDRIRPGKKEKQRSGDSENLPVAADDSKTVHSSTDEAPSFNQSKQNHHVPSEDAGFPFLSGPLSMAFAGQPLASPMIGGSSMPGFGTPSEQLLHDDKLAAWPNIGGKGWSDLCEDWLCRNQTARKDKEHKDKTFISGARLARALSHSGPKRDFAVSRESLLDHQHNAPTPSLSAAVSPQLSRAASPVGIPISTSLPGTPNGSIFEGFHDTSADPTTDASTGADKRKRLLPKLNLKSIDLVKKSTASGRSSPAHLTDTHCVSSPVLLSPTAVRSTGQPFSQEKISPAAQPTTIPASTSFGGLLTVPGAPSMSRVSSSQSLSTLAASADLNGRSVSPAATEVRVEPPTPSRSPSPCPDAPFTSNIGDQTPGETASPAPSAVIGASGDAATNSNGPLRASTDPIPKMLGPYELVIKERMMGCYMAIYVWRGCKDRVRGASRSHVKSGLLAGRLGNKGGVGISLKLGTTRLLFVNAHLAAHEDKVALRLANVAKIKAALKVDSFLPAHDPRSRLEDITEQFDHTFWFGDLNFRIDISRQHADWLMMNKKYSQALAFDQLGKVLKDGDAFRGFKEAPIHFPPTYKYDVLKTLKIKRNKTQTSVRSAMDIPGTGSAATATTKIAASELSTTPLGEIVIPEECAIGFDELRAQDGPSGDDSVSSITPNELAADASSTVGGAKATTSSFGTYAGDDCGGPSAGMQDADRSDEDRFSIASSSAFGSIASSSGFARSYQTQERSAREVDPALVRERELELQRQRQLAENTSAAQGPRFFSQGAAIKAKFKIMDIVRSATNSNLKDKVGGAVSSDSHQGGRKKWLGVLTDSPKKGTPASFPSDNMSTVDSISSMPSPATELSMSNPEADESSFIFGRRGSLLSTDSHLSSRGHGDLPSFRSTFAGDGQTSSSDQENEPVPSTPVRAGPRRSSLQMAKATALAAAKARRDAKYPHLTGATAEQIDFLEAQPYDTSAKQRVPSWCDRVLFRSTVVPAPDDEEEKAVAHEIGLGSRVGSAFSNALITPLRQAAERRHQAHSLRRVSEGLVAAVAGGSSVAFAQEQTASAEFSLVDPMVRKVSATRREKRLLAATPRPEAEVQRSAGGERARHPHLLQRFLHPGRPRHHARALSPSLTLTDPQNGTNWVVKNASSVDLLPTSASLGLDTGSGLGLAGLETRAISTVDLPSQVEERDNRFDGVAKRIASPLLAAKAKAEGQPRVVIPPRGSSSRTSSPVVTVGQGWTTPSPTKSPASLSPLGYAGENKPNPPVRSVSATAAISPTSDLTRTPAPPPAPRRTLSSSSHPDRTWMDSLSSHLPSFLAPAISALRSHKPHPPSSPTRTDATHQEQDVVGPKKGQIECLLYKSLDDREMRLLEARSDHRPVIFVGAIGI